MEELKDRLNKRLKLNEVQEVAQMVSGDLDQINQLLALMETDDKQTSNNALWCIQHFTAKDLNTYIVCQKDRLIDFLLKTNDNSNRRMLLALLRDMDFKEDEVRTDFLDFCLENIVNIKWPVGTRALCIYLAAKLCAFFPELCQELKTVLEVLDEEKDLQPSLKCSKKKVLKQLNLG